MNREHQTAQDKYLEEAYEADRLERLNRVTYAKTKVKAGEYLITSSEGPTWTVRSVLQTYYGRRRRQWIEWQITSHEGQKLGHARSLRLAIQIIERRQNRAQWAENKLG